MTNVLKDWVLSASVLTAAVLLLRLLFHKRISQRLMYALWLPVLLRLLLPFSLYKAPVSVPAAAERIAPAVFVTPAPVPANQPAATAKPADTGTANPAVSAAPIAALSPVPAQEPTQVTETAPAPAEEPLPAAVPAEPINYTRLLNVLWAAGGAVMALWMLAVNLAFQNRLRKDRTLFREGKTPVYVSETVASPCLFGLLRPAVYLTRWAAALEPERLEQVLTHEYMHKRQLDHIWNLLRCLALAVWWWNPLVWLAAVLSRRDGELSCDEGVLRSLGEGKRLDYGHILVDLTPQKAQGALLCAATISGGGKALKERLDRIVKKPKLWIAAAVIAVLLTALIVGCTFGGKGDTPTGTQEPGDAQASETPGPTAARKTYAGDDWGRLYKELVLDASDEEVIYYLSWDSGPAVGFDLLDLSGDGTPELVLYLPGGGMSQAAIVVTFEEGELRCLNRGNAFGLPPSANAIEASAFYANPTVWDGAGNEEKAFFRYYYVEAHHTGEETGTIREGFYLLNSANGDGSFQWCNWYRFGQDEQGKLTCEAAFSSGLGWEEGINGRTETYWLLNGEEVSAYDYHVRADGFRRQLQDYAILPETGDCCAVFRDEPDLSAAVDRALAAWTPLPETVPVTPVSADPAEWLDRLFSGGEKPIAMTLMTNDRGYGSLVLHTELDPTLRSYLEFYTWTTDQANDARMPDSGAYKLTLRGGGVTLDLYQGLTQAVFRAQGEERIFYLISQGENGCLADNLRRQVFDPKESEAAMSAIRVDASEEDPALAYVRKLCEAMKGLTDRSSWGIQEYEIRGVASEKHEAQKELALHTVVYLLPNEWNSVIWWAGAGMEPAAGDYEGWLIMDVYYLLELENGAWKRKDSAQYDPGWGDLELEHLDNPPPEPTPEPTPEPSPEPTPEPTPAPYAPVTQGMGTDWLTLPAGARWLTAEEVADWQAWFEEDWMRWQFLKSAYARPQDVDLYELFYVGVDVGLSSSYSYEHPITDEDIRCTLLHLGVWATFCPTDKLPRNEVDALLYRYLGLGLEETNRIHLSFYYLPETDCFYHVHGDTNQGGANFLYGYALGDEVCLFYNGEAPYYGSEYELGYTYVCDIFRVTLRTEGETVHFLSNVRPLYNGTDTADETPKPAHSVTVNYAGDYGRDVTVVTPLETVDFESFEAARASLEDGMEVLLELAYPGWGTLVYGEAETGTTHGNTAWLFFITESGSRYRLALPGYMMGDCKRTEEWSEVEAGNGFYLSGDTLHPELVTWWMDCVYETRIGGGEVRQGGRCYWTLFLPTMETFAWFMPEE